MATELVVACFCVGVLVAAACAVLAAIEIKFTAARTRLDCEMAVRELAHKATGE